MFCGAALIIRAGPIKVSLNKLLEGVDPGRVEREGEPSDNSARDGGRQQQSEEEPPQHHHSHVCGGGPDV